MIPTISPVPETAVPANSFLLEFASCENEKMARLAFPPPIPPRRPCYPDLVDRSGARDHDACSSATLVEAGTGIPLSAPPTSFGSLRALEEQDRPRHIEDLVREKLDRARDRATRPNAIPLAESESSRIHAPRGGATMAQCRQEEDGGVRLAGGGLGERAGCRDVSDGIPSRAVHEEAWSSQRHSIVTLPPPYEER